MPPIRKSKEIFREQVRWSSNELIGILDFLDNNFEMWRTNRVNASTKAIEATNNKRDARSVYNKIHVLIKSMEVYHKTGEKSNTGTVIWSNKRIQELVENIYIKTKEKSEENQEIEVDDNNSDASTIRTEMDDEPAPYSTEAINKLYSEKLIQLSQTRSTVMKTIEETNNTFEVSKVNLLLYSKEAAIDIFDKKIEEITKLRDELSYIINDINNKYEQMKNFR
ncbi:hypothetical protein RhiirA5_476567 [Rhizophagus irregularis]|uniref:Uncharacterized protein n=4 Tax=Rhizophagus irregularis TaxID=588596 RepID=U9TCR9_RHIID|nr:hypothetical protein GLOIN_2v1722829 [Rhizophagus irregularis DAOM 181602=DAOM 197198]EXX60735.1 hypothetical protein RirG_177230 [Rhizophagus irregularis DAOM 197198w]PKC08665.1 hypothetical protein RhiirA5_476567 [Rhizophagus irregularis]PKK78849.1 hypothetical protein RhiirC2_728664 [Rhizophagus irregularis]PKY20701.1 hypothetical protein RhiirB3_408586 [Rhizophagus irregularis]POG59313.1 hypothetical protein GLOIN_2v1722829 [Rhizophagus irregularis DAOM 181602=DAOM 197198]|eukprot:XP_025166179.1 hypothetical protein GLOIN_2v1722829 [Rhizophagus irregularis DAOM 181602=DAOM 197198]